MPTPVIDIEWDSSSYTLPAPSVNDALIPDTYNHYALVYFPSSGTITGIAKTKRGRPLWLTSTRDTITLAHDSSSSTAGNRFNCPNGQDLALGSGEGAMLVYDHINTRWDVYPQNPNTGTTGTTFPASPYDGQSFYRTDLYEEFRYSAANGAWIGQNIHTHNFGQSGTLSGTTHLRGPGNSPFGGGDRGYWLPDYTWAIINAGYAGAGSMTGSFQVRRDNSTILTLTITAAATAHDLDGYTEFDPDARLQAVLQVSSGTPANVSAWVDVARVFPDS